MTALQGLHRMPADACDMQMQLEDAPVLSLYSRQRLAREGGRTGLRSSCLLSCLKCGFFCGRCSGLKHCSHIFMRWKEQAFAKSGDDCGLTIAGFYYICLCRQTGDVEGTQVPVTHGILSKSVLVNSPTSL